MSKPQWIAVVLVVALFTGCLAVGYASMSDTLGIFGSAQATPPYELYISDITPAESGGVKIHSYLGTTVSARVAGTQVGSFTVTVVNRSTKSYVFERVIEGWETGIDGVYDGRDVTYALKGLTYLQEVTPNGSVTFELTVNNPKGIIAENYLLKFNFIEKTGTEVLPGNPEAPETEPETEAPDTGAESETGGVKPPETETETDAETTPSDPPEMHDNFLGLIEALLSEKENCMNDRSDGGKDVIHSAVMEAASRAPYIVHCHANSVKGGTITKIAEEANRQLTEELHFLFRPVEGREDQIYLYMYYGDEAVSGKNGVPILTYFQVFTCDASSGEWYADGTYVGHAKVAQLGGGGNANKKAWMINPDTWVAGPLPS